MKKRNLHLVISPSGGGKDFIVDKICKEFGSEKVISRTTRPPRYTGESTHLFVNEEQADEEFGRAIAKTIYNGNRYYTLEEDLEKRDFYIIDVNGVRSMQSLENVVVIYIKTSFIKRIFNMLRRGDKLLDILKRIKNDRVAFRGAEEVADIIFKNNHEMYLYFKCIYKGSGVLC